MARYLPEVRDEDGYPRHEVRDKWADDLRQGYEVKSKLRKSTNQALQVIHDTLQLTREDFQEMTRPELTGLELQTSLAKWVVERTTTNSESPRVSMMIHQSMQVNHPTHLPRGYEEPPQISREEIQDFLRQAMRDEQLNQEYKQKQALARSSS